MSEIVLEAGADGDRSSSAFGRAVVAAALATVDPSGAAEVAAIGDWRHDYPVAFRRLTEASAGAAGPINATLGLTAARDHARVTGPAGDAPLAAAFEASGRRLRTADVVGIGEPEPFTLPHAGRRLRGDDVRRLVEHWVARGVCEPGVAAAIDAVLAHPEWLRLPDHRLVVLGAASEMGPLFSLLRWGATVTALDLPRPALWARVRGAARATAGRLRLATGPDGVPGADLLTELGPIANWLSDEPGELVLGHYVYADGVLNLRLALAVDALGVRLTERRGRLGWAGLATPTDAFLVPTDAVAASTQAYRTPASARRAREAVAALSRGRLLAPNYPGGHRLNDSIVVRQGPNYLLAKRLLRWRAQAARAAGQTVSMNVAPPTRTRSVLHNRALATAYAGAGRFGLEVFEPDTAATLMAALLVHDLHTAPDRTAPDHAAADDAETRLAVPGGFWRNPCRADSVLGLALAAGWAGRARRRPAPPAPIG